ncbi:MAG: hypothetical protein ACJAZN_002981 [Planctomycetota bacterium]|jgi:hypothetical protein
MSAPNRGLQTRVMRVDQALTEANVTLDRAQPKVSARVQRNVESARFRRWPEPRVIGVEGPCALKSLTALRFMA